MTLPLYLLAELCAHLPALEAGEMQQGVVVASAPHYTKHDRSSLLFQLDALIRANEIAPQPSAPKEQDKEKARAWFLAQGIKVVESA